MPNASQIRSNHYFALSQLDKASLYLGCLAENLKAPHLPLLVSFDETFYFAYSFYFDFKPIKLLFAK